MIIHTYVYSENQYFIDVRTYICFIFEGLIQQTVTIDLSRRRRRQDSEYSSFIEEVGSLVL